MKKNYTEASAPGRLDVMGGIADYSGSLVLQMPITQQTNVQLTLRDDYQCYIKSKISSGELLTVHVDYRDYLHNQRVDYTFAQNQFNRNKSDAWIAYIIGCALVLQKENNIDFKGADFHISSDVPLGKGVSSSASVEVASMKALTDAFGVELAGTRLPILAQRVENLVVGAPCGLMDQLASYFGEKNKLLPILCQPDKIEKPISLPSDIYFIAIDSGVRHSVAGASYGDVRCAAFMGYSIIAQSLGISIQEMYEAKASHDFSHLPFQGFLCNITVKQLEDSFLQQLPIAMTGKEFLDHHEVSIDHATTIDPKKNYQVRQCASHPVYEHDRVHRFKEYLLALNELPSTANKKVLLQNMGELMHQSHESYSRCGLGSDRTDEIVAMAKKASGVYGAKITGGGNGGTVCLLVDEDGKNSARAIHQTLCKKYKEDLMLFES
jgi:L-arabinokinase